MENDNKSLYKNNQPVSRISISLPEELLRALDNMIDKRGFESRSQAICDMIAQQVDEHRKDVGDEIMTGTLNLVFDYSVPGLQKKIYDFQHIFVDEIISCLNVHLTHTNTMSVMILQGPAHKLTMIADKMTTLRGVITGKLLLSSIIIPPIHPMPKL
jgi:CopG family nickel-responsive transcriptional regulator